VYNIISEHGGEVNVESELGKGSAFRIHLPRASAGESHAEIGARPARVPVSPLRILVVDDEAAIRNVLARYLTRRGHQVHVAAEGGEALRLVAAQEAGQTYDAIVSDLRMPGLGGDQLLTRLKALGTGLDRRVIFLTGDAAAGDAARILAESDAPVIYKPVELEELALRIERRALEVRGPPVQPGEPEG
jgi:CheY-like chemotaxis protein